MLLVSLSYYYSLHVLLYPFQTSIDQRHHRSFQYFQIHYVQMFCLSNSFSLLSRLKPFFSPIPKYIHYNFSFHLFYLSRSNICTASLRIKHFFYIFLGIKYFFHLSQDHVSFFYSHPSRVAANLFPTDTTILPPRNDEPAVTKPFHHSFSTSRFWEWERTLEEEEENEQEKEN